MLEGLAKFEWKLLFKFELRFYRNFQILYRSKIMFELKIFKFIQTFDEPS